MLAFFAVASAQTTRVFETDEATVSWIGLTRGGMRARLPVIGPSEAERLDLRGLDVELIVHAESDDPEAVALEARMRVGAPCAVALAPLDAGWVAWTSGHCGLLFLGAWHLDDGRVFDDRDRPVTVLQFAAEGGDTEVAQTYRRLDRRRARGIWNGMLGTGLLYTGGLGLAGTLPGDNRTPWYVLLGAGGVLTGAGLGQLIWAQADPRSHPRRIDAYYDEAEMERRVLAHNHRLRLVWTLGPTGGGLLGAF